MKVSIITVVFNCSGYITNCIESIVSQDYQNIEYIVIDGGSTDGTVPIIKKYNNKIAYFRSEKDNGMYDALNKGLSVATGDLIGVLNADDLFATNDVVSAIVACFKQNDCDIVYGNLNFTSRNNIKKITRQWKSRPYDYKKLKYGWMPAHPTMYVKKDVFINQGCYSLGFGSCADYELILRFLHTHKTNAVFLDKLMVFMRNGGMSNGSVKKAYRTMINDYKALIYNKIPNPVLVLFLKKIRKLNQFFIRI